MLAYSDPVRKIRRMSAQPLLLNLDLKPLVIPKALQDSLRHFAWQKRLQSRFSGSVFRTYFSTVTRFLFYSLTRAFVLMRDRSTWLNLNIKYSIHILYRKNLH